MIKGGGWGRAEFVSSMRETRRKSLIQQERQRGSGRDLPRLFTLLEKFSQTLHYRDCGFVCGGLGSGAGGAC